MGILNRLQVWWLTRGRPNPERFWNRLSVEERGTIVAQEGLTGLDVTKRWFDLTVTERAFLVSAVGMVEMMAIMQRLSKNKN